MVIRKVGNEWCVFSKNSGKNLGCSSTYEGAVKRLREVEYFKHSQGKNILNEEIFDNFKISPESKTVAEGTIAGTFSNKVLDKKEHFPVITPDQAKSSMQRVMRLEKIPDWYTGTLDELKYAVYAGIKTAHPTLNITVNVPIATALSDGETNPETQKSKIKNPNDDGPNHVKQVKRPTLGSVWENASDDVKTSIANQLIEKLDHHLQALNKAKDLANKLMQGGLSGEEFAKLDVFLQEDVLQNVLMNDAQAQKQAILAKMNKK